MFLYLRYRSVTIGQKAKLEALRLLQNEKGEFVGTIGWMAVIATVLVLTHGLISGWLPDFIERIFSRLDTLV